MAELSVDEAQRLARQFLTGAASVADIQRLQSDLNDDLSLELLAQIQTALDDVAPAGLTVDQAKSVDSRIEALVVPRIKKSGAFGWLKKLFKSKPKAEADEAPAKKSKFKTGKPAPEPVVAPPLVEELPAPSVMDGDGLEEMAPISAAPAEAPVEAVPEAKTQAPVAPVDPEAAAKRKALLKKGLLALAVLFVLALLGLGVRWFLHRPKSVPVPVPVVVVQPTPLPTLKPTPISRTPQRGRILSQPKQEPLPAQLPAMTPQPAGQLE